ncbi:Mitochondrial import inner membrane translocase subunit TIM22-1 [Capsicum annuum]|nr:Mitochondrial import inner membrane translocase subunit TIM22-1 [Capsicum annuum]
MSDPEVKSNDAQSSSQEAKKPQIEPIRMPTVEEIRGQDIWNNCAVRSVVSGVMGGGLGLFMGMFLGALDNPIMQEEMTTRQQIVFQAKQMGRRSWSSCKTFAVMGLVFSAAECTVEKVRAKHDMTNTAVAGCVTGGTLSARVTSPSTSASPKTCYTQTLIPPSWCLRTPHFHIPEPPQLRFVRLVCHGGHSHLVLSIIIPNPVSHPILGVYCSHRILLIWR